MSAAKGAAYNFTIKNANKDTILSTTDVNKGQRWEFKAITEWYAYILYNITLLVGWESYLHFKLTDPLNNIMSSTVLVKTFFIKQVGYYIFPTLNLPHKRCEVVSPARGCSLCR